MSSVVKSYCLWNYQCYVCVCQRAEQFDSAFFALLWIVYFNMQKIMWQLLLKRESHIYPNTAEDVFCVPFSTPLCDVYHHHMGAVWYSVSDGILQM